MKIKIDVDCTPEEARTFLGLPDVGPMQDALLTEIQKRLMANLDAMDPETMIRTWMPIGLQGLESLQKMFWTQMSKGAGEPPKTPGDKTKP